MARKYVIEIFKDGKVVYVVEESNHFSQRIREMEWAGYRFDMSDIWKKVKKANQ
jgi:hypothetical protein